MSKLNKELLTTGVNKQNENVRWGLFEAYNKTDAHTNLRLDYLSMDVDHIIPESWFDNRDKYGQELNELLDKCELPRDIHKNSIYNLVPTHRKHNVTKGNKIDRGFALHLLTKSKEKAEKVKKNIDSFQVARNLELSLSKIKATSQLSPEDVFDFLTNDQQSIEVVREVNEKDYKYKNLNQTFMLYGYLPNINNYGSCILSFHSLKIRGCLIEFSHSEVVNLICLDLINKVDMKDRSLIENHDTLRNIYSIKLKNLQLSFGEDELREICEAFDDFAQIYLKKLREREELLETTTFDLATSNYGYRLLKVSKDIWKAMIKFTKQHDYDLGSSDWHVFSGNDFMIRIDSKSNSGKYSEGIHSVIIPEQENKNLFNLLEEDDMVWLTWQLPTKINLKTDISEQINERKIWNARITHDWLIDELIPQLEKERLISADESNLFKRRLGGMPTNPKELSENVERLQRYFSGIYYDNMTLLEEHEINSLLKAIHETLLYSDKGNSESYLREKLTPLKLGLTDSDNKQQIIMKINQNLGQLEEQSLSYGKVAHLLKLIVFFSDEKTSRLNKTEVKKVYNLLKSFFDREAALNSIERTLKD
ncbi:HNH endonuclease domain-containing protein [Sutcliffiella deserti]|uniref:HNH endonuclease domain-containing protein n=1 Tax=Sutcliffiella deserti TaxID=2875501 RepID=UPI001CBD84CD|nr:HNH endonuclease domain-containing protein [Sutcliffiella deserti]